MGEIGVDAVMIEEADVIVVGMGPAGEHVAGELASAGLDVVGIDRELVGGECPYWGCIPSKMMLRAAHLLAEARRIPGMAGDATVTPDWGPVAARIREEATDDWDDTVAVERFEGKGGRFVRGHGRLVDPHTVEVDGALHVARGGIVLATGTTATIPPVPGIETVPVWTNREAIATPELPSSLIVLGGGAIGVELGQVFARFGVEVTMVEAEDRLVPLDEPEAGDILEAALQADGARVLTGASATSISPDGAGVRVELEDGTALAAARLLVATGRRVDLAAVGAGALGIDETLRSMPVDERMRAADGVWAVGDVTGEGAFTHVGIYQAGIAVADILGREHHAADYRALPRVTFTDPEVASVGLTERAAREAGVAVAVGRAEVPSTARGWLHKAGNAGVIKVVADTDRQVLVGATAVGPAAGEVLALLTLAVHAAVPLAQLRSMIYAYPTFHRGIEDALRDLDA